MIPLMFMQGKRKGLFNMFTVNIVMSRAFKNQRALEGDSRMPKNAADTKFQMQNNFVQYFPMLQCFAIN